MRAIPSILCGCLLGIVLALPLLAQEASVPPAPVTPTVAPALVPPATAAEPSTLAPDASVSATGTPALTRDDATAWLDGFMPYALASGDIAGAVVVVVKDGQVLLQKGYGIRTWRRAQPSIRKARCSVRARCRSCSPGPR